MNIPQRHSAFGRSPEALTTTELLTDEEQARLRWRLRLRLSLVGCLLLGGAWGGWALHRQAESGAWPWELAAFAVIALLGLGWLPGLFRQCRLAHADYRAGIKRVIRGPLLASERASGARRHWPRFRWLIGNALIGIDVNLDFIYIRGRGGRRLRPGDCEAMQSPGRMLEVHVTVASGMALYVASAG